MADDELVECYLHEYAELYPHTYVEPGTEYRLPSDLAARAIAAFKEFVAAGVAVDEWLDAHPEFSDFQRG